MTALIPFPTHGPGRDRGDQTAGRPTPDRLLRLASHRPELSSRRWHAGEARFSTYTHLMTRGALMPIGGEEEPEPESPILNALFGLAGGKSGRIMLVPTSGDPRDVETYRRLLTRRGAVVDLGIISRAGDANDPVLAGRLTGMTGLFIIGGPTEACRMLSGGTRLAEAIRAANERGLVVAGCGTGALLLGRYQPPPDQRGAGGGDGPVLTGLGLLDDDLLIDRHATTPGRIEQLLAAFAARPAQVVFCLPQQTALIVTPDRRARVLGQRSVVVIDGRPAASDPRDAAGAGLPTVTGARLHLLAPGRIFDLDRGRVLDPLRGPIGRPAG